jgi:hypothetical protein
MSELSKKCVAIFGMGLGAAGVLASAFICESSLELGRQLNLFLGPNEPPYVMVVIMAALGLVIIIAAFDFGFHKRSHSRDEHKRQ